VAADLALVADRLLVVEDELDRVLDREDVAGHLLIARLEHRRERRALAGARRADHQDQATLFHHERAQDRRHVEALERRDLERDAAEHRRDRAALLESGETEAADAGEADADVELAGVLELLELAGSQQLRKQLARLRVRQRLVGELQQLAVDLDQDRRARRQVHVRRALFGHQPEDALHVARAHVRTFHIQLRRSSLMFVLARVRASTRLTMTAQYRLWLPSAAGRLPLTTTEPAGTRP